MNEDLRERLEQTLAFARYLSWADLMNELFEEEVAKDVDEVDAAALREHEWRWFGLMCYWYSSLNVVVEAWDHLGFSDPVVDRLLAHPKQFRALLRRYRNAVFHYQKSLLDPRFIELLAHGAVHVFWISALHAEFVRFFAEHLSAQMVTDAQRTEFREDIEAVIHWYPYREAPQIDSLERTLAYGRELLAKYADDQSKGRQELKLSLESAEATLREGRHSWATLRAHILREAGIK